MIDLAAAFREVIARCDPARRTADAALGLGLAGPVWIAAVGKAARAMASGAASVVPVAGGLVVVPEGVPAAPLPPSLAIREAAHPVPDARSEAAGRALLALAASVPRDGTLLALVSGGASALAAVPAPGLTLAAKVARVQALAAQGAPIAELNRLRTSLSAIKGGRLAAACPGRVVTVVVSDVVGDDLAVVGSGPTIPCDRAVLASGLSTLAAAAAAVTGGTIATAALAGDLDTVHGTVSAQLRDDTVQCTVSVGEPTVALPARPGRGGRMRHLALLVARDLAGVPGWRLLAAGSDGIDGTPDAAGAIVDGETWAKVPDGDGALARFDSGTALAAAGCALVTGPTGVNHADLIVAIRLA